jgi:hypothetical protein
LHENFEHIYNNRIIIAVHRMEMLKLLCQILFVDPYTDDQNLNIAKFFEDKSTSVLVIKKTTQSCHYRQVNKACHKTYHRKRARVYPA